MAVHLRWPLAFWNAVFLDNQPYRVQACFDVAWNRGAYLVQGLDIAASFHTREVAMPGKGAR